MPRNLNDLGKMFDRLPRELKTAASMAAVSASRVIIKDLSNNTPVDTTKAVSNWIVTLKSPATGEIGSHVPGRKGDTKTPSALQTYSAAVAILASKKPGQVVYITNNVDYVKLLNEGSSKQQPAGFVQRAVYLGRLAVRNYKIKLTGT